MGLEKTELQREFLFHMGVRADDRVEALRGEQKALEGAMGAYREAAVKIGADVAARLQKEIEGGAVSLEVANVVTKYITTCVHYLQHLEKQTGTRVIVAQGQLLEAQRSLAALKQQHDELAARAKVLAEHPTAEPTEPGERPKPRVPGQRVLPFKQQRMAKGNGAKKPRKGAKGRTTEEESPNEETAVLEQAEVDTTGPVVEEAEASPADVQELEATDAGEPEAEGVAESLNAPDAG